MNTIKLLQGILGLIMIVSTCISAQNNCTDLKDYNSDLMVHICLEESPEDIDNSSVKPILPSEQFAPVYGKYGDMVQFKYIKGQNISTNLFIGYLNRSGRVNAPTSHDPSEIRDRDLLGPGTKHTAENWGGPFSWPNDEEGIRMARLTEKGLALPSGDWLITIKYKLSQKAIGWDLEKNPLVWGVLSDYDKAYPFYFILDGRENATPAQVEKSTTAGINPVSISQKGENLFIQLEQNTNSSIEINSLDGRTVLEHHGHGQTISMALNILPAGIYSVNIIAGKNRMSQNVFVR